MAGAERGKEVFLNRARQSDLRRSSSTAGAIVEVSSLVCNRRCVVMGCPYVCNGTCMNTFAHAQHEHLCAVHMEGFYMGELVPSLEAPNLARAALRTPNPTP